MTELLFKGKEFVFNHHLTVPFRPLVPHPEKGIGPARLDGNLIIHGDNLHGLKALLPMYAGKIDCIFIDPPYNTGNEGWCYNDNVNSPMIKEWLSANPIGIEDGLRHDKWCAMMWPRLRLLHELLSEDGVIFACIDYNEAHRLRALMEEVFGIDNFRNEIIIRRGIKNVQSQFDDISSLATGHDSLLLFSKSPTMRLPKLSLLSEEDQAGKWDTFWRGTDRSTMRYEIFGVKPSEGQWRWQKTRADQAVKNYIEYVRSYSDSMSLDEFYHLRSQELGTECDFLRQGEDGTVQYYVSPRNYKLLSDVWLRLASSGKFTDFPHEKGLELIETAIGWVSKDNSIILDSFAGSGSTAHAVMNLNKKNSGSRKFILIEMEQYAERITAARIRKAIDEDKVEFGLMATNTQFTYCTLGDPVEIDAILSGKALPTQEALASVLWHMATARTFDPAAMTQQAAIADGLFRLGDHDGRVLWLIYKPDLDWLKSSDAALSLAKARAIAATSQGEHLVFAPAKFVSRELLQREKLNVEYAPLPFALYKLEKA